MKKTIRIEVVVDTAQNTAECRRMLRNAIYDNGGNGSHQPLRHALTGVLGWSGEERSLSITVSNPPRNAHVQP